MVKRILGIGLLLTLIIPVAVFVASGVGSGVSAQDTLSALNAQFGAERTNLWMTMVAALLPLALLSFIVWLFHRFAPPDRHVPSLALGGLVPILTVQIWVHFQYWPKFFPDLSHPSWPHGMEFVIGPIFYAPVAMALGLLAAFLVTKVTRRAEKS